MFDKCQSVCSCYHFLCLPRISSFPVSLILSTVICNFRGSVTQGLALEVGETVQILEKCEGWYRGFSTRKPNVKVSQKHKVDLFYKVRHVMMELIDLRRQLLSGHLTQDQSRDVKRHITVRLDWGNEHLGLDLVPRKEFEMVDEDQISVSDLYKMHLSSRHSVQQSTTQGDNARQRHGEPCRVPVPHHLLVNLKSFTYNSIGEDTDIFFSLYDLREGKTLSEKFMVRLNKNGGPKNPEKVDRLCALFTVTTHTRLMKLVVRRLKISDLFFLLFLFVFLSDVVCNNENEWYQIHENIIRKSSTKYTAPSTNYGLIISLQLLRGDMEQVRRENPLIFSRGVAITRKLGFPDVIMPGDIRNDLYLTLERGDFERGGKSVQKNIEVTIYVLYADGEILKDCISLGSGEPNVPEHRSFVLYHNNSPRWSEVIKLPIPIDRFRGSHLRFEFRHCSTKDKGEKKLFGFAFTPLMREDGTTLSDESHELYVYKVSYTFLFPGCCSSAFITRQSFILQRSRTFFTATVNHDSFSVHFRVTRASHSLITVSVSQVFIINLLRDSKYYHFRPVMDTYIQKHFAGALAYKELIRCLKWYMDRSAEVVRQDHIQEAMRALEYLFKFIIQSRILYSRATCGMEEEQFRTSVQELFQSIRFVLSLDSRNSETLIFTQAALLNSFPAIFDELLQMFTVQEVAEFVRGTLGSMPSTVHIGQSMDVVKLQSIARTVDSRLFSFPGKCLDSFINVAQNMERLRYCTSLINSSVRVDALEKSGEYVSCLLSLLRQMTDIHFQHLMENFQSKDELKEFLLKIMCVFRNLMKLSIFPRDWNIMRLLTSNIILTTVQYLSPALHKNFTEADFDFKVWNSYFSLAVLYINQPSLQLENLSPAKRKKVLDKYGDMRVMMTYELFSMWQNLGENKIHFIPGMIGPFLGVTLVPQVEVRNIMIPIFHDMMDWEQRKNGNFKQVEAELIDKLDSLVSEGKGDENYRELFGLLTQLFGPYPRYDTPCTWADIRLNQCINTGSALIVCFVSSQNFYKSEINKEEMYIRYIHKLCDMHLQAENYTEAAFTLLLYWELLHWDERPLKEFLHYPAQTEWHRKEGLCRKVIHYFNKGKVRALTLTYLLFPPVQHPHYPLEGSLGHPPKIVNAAQFYTHFYKVTVINRFKRESTDFYRVNNVRRFRYDRPFHKGPKDRDNEFKVRQEVLFPLILKIYTNSPGIIFTNNSEISCMLFLDALVGPALKSHDKKIMHIKVKQCFYVSLQGLPGLDKSGSGPNTPRGILATHGPMSPESFKLMHRHSPIAVLTPVRNSSSSLSSHNSSEMGNVGNLLILADGMVVEHPEDFYRMQVSEKRDSQRGNASLSSSSLSSTHSAPSQMINSAPSTIRVGSPSLPDKYRHNREMLMLLPPHRERPSSAMYTNITDNGQPPNFQRALFHQVIGPCKPCSDPNLSVAEKGQHLSMHFDAFHHQVSDLPPALPARLLQMIILILIAPAPVRYSVSEPEVLDGVKPPPCRSHSAPGGVTPAQAGSQIQPQAPGLASIGVQQMQQQDALPHPQHPHYYHQLHHHFHPHYIPHHPPLYHLHEPPALPPKPYLREGCIPEEDSLISQSAAPPPPAPRPMPRKISQPIIAATKDEQAKVAWEHGIGEE
uniref:Dedicator of cytokinesis 3 n=1 Tax=Neolamprologus brichardi TaxID=32507 RepID=A0A3Q4GV87_NEOBR